MDATKLFKDVLVLELASVLAGPATGQFFAEVGARVIKIENHMKSGDVTRSWYSQNENSSISAYFTSVNWGKESIGIDLSAADGQKLLHALTTKADIILTSFKPGSAEKLEADYATLRKINEKIIYGSITGYGPNNDRVGYDAVIQAESGFMSINGEPGGPPLKLPVALIDLLAAHQLKQAVLLAWINRLSTEEGCEVSVSLFDAAVSSLANQSANYLHAGIEPKAQGSLHPNIAPYGESFVTADGQRLLLAVGNDRQFTSLCEILELPGVPADPRFVSNSRRVQNRNTLFDILAPAFRARTSKAILDDCRLRNVPAGYIRSIKEVLDAEGIPMLEKQGFRMVPTFTATSRFPSLEPPPRLGEHTVAILSEIAGLSKSEIAQLHNKQVIT